MSFGVILFVISAIVVLLMGVAIYNNLVSLKNQIDRAWTNVEILLKQRFDEIPQLIQVVEQYASYEQKTLQRVIEARNTFAQSASMGGKIEASNEMSLALKGLVALGEAYPDLKANQSFM
ncbi:MAG: LemA family protein, partial [Proteobacteria bacterium]